MIRLHFSRRARRSVLGGGLLFVAAAHLGCAGATSETTPVVAPGPVVRAPDASDPPLTSDEEAIRDRLARHVRVLATEIGERHTNRVWELASAAAYVALEFEELGYGVERMGEEVDGVALQTLAVTVPGGARGDQQLVIGARYDSPRGSAGRGEAAATAALLELARTLRGARPSRAIRLVAFPLGAAEVDPSRRSGAHFVRDAVRVRSQFVESSAIPSEPSREEDAAPTEDLPPDVVGFLELGRLDRFERDSAMRSVVRWGASPGAADLAGLLVEGLEGAPLVAEEARWAEYDGESAHFEQKNVPSVWLDGGAKPTSDAPSGRWDVDTLARIVHRLRFGLAAFTGESATNGGMLTPDLPAVR